MSKYHAGHEQKRWALARKREAYLDALTGKLEEKEQGEDHPAVQKAGNSGHQLAPEREHLWRTAGPFQDLLAQAYLASRRGNSPFH